MSEDINMKIISSDNTHFEVRDMTGDSLTVTYHTLVGNNPNQNGNYIAVWQGEDLEIPWGQAPKWVGQIDGSDRDGDFFMENLNLTNLSYVVGYSVVPETEGGDNFCAVALVPPADDSQKGEANDGLEDSSRDDQSAIEHIAYLGKLREEAEYIAPYISMESLQSTSIRIGYNMPSGYDPEEKLNWVALWEGKPNMYKKVPDYAVPVSYSKDTGSVLLHWEFKRSTKYTVGYFASGWNKDVSVRKQNGLICSLTFET